jgi:hypothetical protein
LEIGRRFAKEIREEEAAESSEDSDTGQLSEGWEDDEDTGPFGTLLYRKGLGWATQTYEMENGKSISVFGGTLSTALGTQTLSQTQIRQMLLEIDSEGKKQCN